MAAAFLGVQLAIFGVYMGAFFAPNHKGMPIVPAGVKMDFFSKQVRTSRKISGGRGMGHSDGRAQLPDRASPVPEHGAAPPAEGADAGPEHRRSLDVPYSETSLIRSYGIVIAYLNRVGLSARDPFNCPLAGQLGRG